MAIGIENLVNSYIKTSAINNFNGKETIKYYIHDSTGWQYNLNENINAWTYTYNHLPGEENYIDYVFNSIDPYISLDFEKVYSASEGDIDIYMLGEHSSPSSLGFATFDQSKTEVYWYATSQYYSIGYGTLKDDDAYTLIHEIGHALGLSHPQLNGVDDPNGNWHDSDDTVMSYNYSPSSTPPNWKTLDIQALQNIWGPEADSIAPLIQGPVGSAGDSSSGKTIDENTTTVHTFTANETVTWSINGGNDPSFFSINSTTGLLTFNNAPDYENALDSNANGIYSIYVKATDSAGNSSSQWVEITVADVVEDTTAPLISGPSGSAGASISQKVIDENTTTVYTFTANETVTWSIDGGLDPSFFSINASTGLLTFKNAPDYENPLDSNSNGAYSIILKATDSAGNSSNQFVSVSIADVLNEVGDTVKPIIYGVNGVTTASSFLSINENQTYINTFVASEEVTWSLKSSWDQNSLYKIDPVSGVLSFKQAPDFENPSSFSNPHTSSQISLYPIVIATDPAGNYQQQNMMLLINNIENEVPITSIAATSTELQQLYIGYFGRPCDPTGLDYWLDQKVTKKAFAANMYLQPEFNSVNGNLSTIAQVNQIYLNLFNREGDAAGLNYWAGQIDAGNLELASIANDLTWAALNNAGSEVDGKTLNHKANAAILYTYEIRNDTASILAYQPSSTSPWVTGNNLTEAKTFINGIGNSKVATISEIQSSIGKFTTTANRFQLSHGNNPIDNITGLQLNNLPDDFLENLRQYNIANFNQSIIKYSQEPNHQINYVKISDQQYTPNLYIIDECNDWVGQSDNREETRYEVLLGSSLSAENQLVICDTSGLA